MVPFADKGNHNHKADAIWAFLTKEESSGFYVHATRDIAAGEQVYYSYGCKPNSQLLSFYGFTLPDNPCPVELILWHTLEVDSKDPLKSPKKSIVDSVIFQASSKFNHSKTKQTLAILRFVFFDDKSNLVKLNDKTQVRYFNNGKKKFTRK